LSAELQDGQVLLISHHRIVSYDILKITKLILEHHPQMIPHLSFFYWEVSLLGLMSSSPSSSINALTGEKVLLPSLVYSKAITYLTSIFRRISNF
jgi:hypothetical protein